MIWIFIFMQNRCLYWAAVCSPRVAAGHSNPAWVADVNIWGRPHLVQITFYFAPEVFSGENFTTDQVVVDKNWKTRKSNFAFCFIFGLTFQLKTQHPHGGAIEELQQAFILAEEMSPGICDRLSENLVSRVNKWVTCLSNNSKNTSSNN